MNKVQFLRRFKYGKHFLGFLCIIIFRLIYYKNVEIGQLYADSTSYIEFPFHDFIHLNFTSHRTPVYPLIIRICRFAIGDSRFLIGVVLIQIICSFISLYFLYRLIEIATSNQLLAVIATVIYGSSPLVMGWDTIILTESLGLSSSVVFLYFIVRYIQRPRIHWGLVCIIWTLMITFLRPSFLPFNYALLIFWFIRIFFNKDEKGVGFVLLIASMLSIGFIFWYSYISSMWSGIFAITPLSPKHLMVPCLEVKLYKNYPDSAIVNQIDEMFNRYDNNLNLAIEPIMKSFGTDFKTINQNSQKFAMFCVKNNFGRYLVYLIKRVLFNINTTFEPYNNFIYENVISRVILQIQFMLFSGVKIGHTYFIAAAELVFFIHNWRLQKSIHWYHFGLASMLILILVFVYVGSYSSYGRLLIHILPFVVLGVALSINEFYRQVCLKCGIVNKK